jgi:5-methyltetrahydrofolate--homocysteine methyltransferase
MDALSKLLSTRDWLMADGATGTNLFNMGLTAGEPPEFWNTDKPDNIRKLYKAAVDAGSDIFLTNTFGGNASRLKLQRAGPRPRVEPYWRKSGARNRRCFGPHCGCRRLDGADGRDF